MQLSTCRSAFHSATQFLLTYSQLPKSVLYWHSGVLEYPLDDLCKVKFHYEIVQAEPLWKYYDLPYGCIEGNANHDALVA